MAIDFSAIQGTPAKTGKIDFSSVGGTSAAGQEPGPEDNTTTLGAAGRGAVGMIPLGEQGYAAADAMTGNKPYLQARQELDREIASDKENHPVARVAGQAAGVIAPALLTAGASAPESLAAAAGEGAALGTGFGAGNAIDTLAKGGSGTQAAADVALGAATGAAGGAAGRGLGSLFSKGASALEDTALEKSMEAMRVSPKILGNMTPEKYLESQHMVNNLGLATGEPADMLAKAQTALDSFGHKIGAVGDQADALGLTLKDPGIVARPIGDKMAQLTDMADPDAVAAMNKYKAGYASLQALTNKYPNGIPWDELQRLKSGYGNIAFKSGEVASQPAADVYFALKDGMQSIADSAQDNPELGQDLKDSLKGYNLLSPIVDGLKSKVGAARAGQGGGGMGSMVVGGAMLPSRPFMGARILARGAGSIAPESVAKAATGAAEAMSNVAGAAPGVGAQVAGAAMSPVPVQQNMGKTMPINGQGTPAPTPVKNPATAGPNLDHPALAAWKSTFQKNAAAAKDPAEVEKSNAVTDFTLSQRDPAYAAAKQKAADSPVSAPNRTDQEPVKMADGGTVLARSTEAPGEGFNTDMADKLKKFVMDRKEKRYGQPK